MCVYNVGWCTYFVSNFIIRRKESDGNVLLIESEISTETE